MSKYYQGLDEGHFDYQLCELDGDPRHLFRGPAVDRSRPYIVCLGAAQTFGRFCHKPFPQLLSEHLGLQVLNLGIGGSGPSAFLRSHYLAWLNGAEAVVVQVLSGRSEGNSLFDNSAHGGLRGIRLSDGVEMRYEQFLAELIASSPTQLVEEIVRETRDNYVLNMNRLLEAIRKPKILLWLSNRSPRYFPDLRSPLRTLGAFPQLVNEEMLEKIRPHADVFVECIAPLREPQRLWEADKPIDGAALKEGVLYNFYYPSPDMHVQAASMLAAACRAILPGKKEWPEKDAEISHSLQPTRFIIVCAERTGSTMLSFLLDSHRDCQTAGELFNPKVIESGQVPGLPVTEQSHLDSLRKTDIPAFINEVFEGNERRGYKAVGFKLMYGHGTANSQILDFLVQDKSIRVIHLRRRNMLHRFVSKEQATQTGIWAQRVGTKKIPMPQVDLNFSNMIMDFMRVEERDSRFTELFSGHNVLNLFYEDLAVAPVEVGRRAVRFLGLSEDEPLTVGHQKTGVDSMREAISNYEDVKQRILKWLTYFDE